MKMKMKLIALSAVVTVACGEKVTANIGSNEQLITRQTYNRIYKEDWLFKPDALIVGCRVKPNSNRNLITARVPGSRRLYGVNHAAQYYHNNSFHDLKVKSRFGTVRYGGLHILDIGASLCESNE